MMRVRYKSVQRVLSTIIFLVTSFSYASDNKLSYKNYLFINNDGYSCDALLQYRCVGGSSENKLSCVNDLAIKECKQIAALNAGGISLNDSYNQFTAINGGKNTPEITRVTTLFAPYIMTYDPDYPNKEKIGKPVNNNAIQQIGYQKIINKQPSCVEFDDNHGLKRFSPYTSHCSAYTAWVAEKVFGVNLYPVQVGDWCHVAAEQRDRMYFDKANWLQVDSIGAQKAANQGRLVLAVLKKESKTSAPHQQNGHIAVVLPSVNELAHKLQQGNNYPLEPSITNTNQYETFIKTYGPEVAQAGGLNFNHTITANAFSSYYSAKDDVGKKSVDQVIEFFVYNHKTQPEYDD